MKKSFSFIGSPHLGNFPILNLAKSETPRSISTLIEAPSSKNTLKNVPILKTSEVVIDLDLRI